MFFFFKQKTAYEMRISDWSSDVCSSDLRDGWCPHGDANVRQAGIDTDHQLRGGQPRRQFREPGFAGQIDQRRLRGRGDARGGHAIAGAAERSEEHTSELQSLIRISYAVFCLKKKKNITPHQLSN